MLQPAKPDAVPAASRIDHVRSLRARVLEDINGFMGGNKLSYPAEKTLPFKVEKKISELRISNPIGAAELEKKLSSLISYNEIIHSMKSAPQKDVEISGLPPEVVRAIPKNIGLPLTERNYEYVLKPSDFARLAALVDKPDCGFDSPAGGATFAGERAAIHVDPMPNEKKR